MKITLFIFGLLFSFIHVEAEVHPLFAAANKQYQEQQYDSALMLFNQLIQEFPERKEGYFNRGLCLYKTEKYSEAVLDLGTCLQMDSVFSLARLLKGLCLQQSGNLQEAMQTYSEISGDDARLFSTQKRVKNYNLSVYLATRWYYMVAMAISIILLVLVWISMLSRKKLQF